MRSVYAATSWALVTCLACEQRGQLGGGGGLEVEARQGALGGRGGERLLGGGGQDGGVDADDAGGHRTGQGGRGEQRGGGGTGTAWKGTAHRVPLGTWTWRAAKLSSRCVLRVTPV